MPVLLKIRHLEEEDLVEEEYLCSIDRSFLLLVQQSVLRECIAKCVILNVLPKCGDTN